MKSVHHILSLVVLGFLCSGCLKLEHHVASPGARGIVLDAQTHAPLGGAQVVVSSWSDFQPPTVSDALAQARPPVVTTRANGRFHISEEGHWNLVVDYLIEPLHDKAGGTLVVQRDGYQPAVVQLWGDIAPLTAHPTNFVEVLLSPVTK